MKLQEEGKLGALKLKWWKEMYGGGKCSSDESAAPSDAAELGIANVGGVFVVLVCGLACGLIIGLLEFLWNIRALAVENKITQIEALKGELKFALNFWITAKPVNTHDDSAVDIADAGSDLEEEDHKGYSRQNSETISHKIKTISLTNLNKIFNKKN